MKNSMVMLSLRLESNKILESSSSKSTSFSKPGSATSHYEMARPISSSLSHFLGWDFGGGESPPTDCPSQIDVPGELLIGSPTSFISDASGSYQVTIRPGPL
jgi:hypothetical protein